MSNVYYGVCDSAADDAIKIVNMLEDSSLSSINDLRIGDLFAIYFSNDNTASSITIKLTSDVGNQDDNENDAGLVVKTMNVEEDCADLWHKGEAVIFVCSAISENSEVNTGQDGGDQLPNAPDVYLRLLDSGKASTDIYGATKIWEKPDTIPTLEDAIAEIGKTVDDDVALAPWILELIYERLGASIQVTYENLIDDANPVTLGNLKVIYNNDTENPNSFPITIPPQAVVRNTSELINDGDSADETPNGYYNGGQDLKEDGKFFITNTPAREIYFTGDGKENDKTGGVPAYLFKRESIGGSTVDTPLLGRDTDEDTNKNITKLYGDTIDLGDVTKVTNAGAISTTSLTTSGDIISTDGSLKTEKQDIYEKNQALNTRYSGKLSIIPYTFLFDGVDHKEINPNSLSGHKTYQIIKDGYRCLGIVGHNYNYANSNSEIDSSYVLEWELFPNNLTDGQVTLQLDIRNLSSKKIDVKLVVYLLWEKIV